MKKIKFSFIIPTKNEKGYIEHCLESIREQKRKDYEIIVVDSFSKDGTGKIARKYGARLFNESRGGPAVARNTGADEAKGEILIFSDADVVFPRDFLYNLEKKFRKNVAGGICGLVAYDAKNNLTLINYVAANIIVKFLISVGIPMTAGSCFIYRKHIFMKTGGFNPKFLTNEDHDMAKKVSKLGRFCFFDDIILGTSTRRMRKWGTYKTVKVYFKSTAVYFLNHGYLRDYWI